MLNAEQQEQVWKRDANTSPTTSTSTRLKRQPAASNSISKVELSAHTPLTARNAPVQYLNFLYAIADERSSGIIILSAPSVKGVVKTGRARMFRGVSARSPLQNHGVMPHGQALAKLITNDKLPKPDAPRVRAAQACHLAWTKAMDDLTSTNMDRVTELVGLLNGYKRYIDLDLVWDSPADFLYRQSGQLKLGSTVLEEFLPRLCHPSIIPSLENAEFFIGPRRTLVSMWFTTPPLPLGVEAAEKDQDFTICQVIDVKLLANGSQVDNVIAAAPYLTAEIKTNLDFTMFQGIAATAGQMKALFPGSHCYVICEWTDMKDRSCAGTPIDEVLVLRGRRVSADVRKKWAELPARRRDREAYVALLDLHPIRVDMMQRFVAHIQELFTATDVTNVVSRGYF